MREMPTLKERTQLKLDYDSENWFQLYQERMRKLLWVLEIKVIKERFYKSSGGNHHVRVWLDKLLSPWEVIILQAVLGSDPIRELFNLRRVNRGQRNWNLLFNTSENYEEIT